MSNSLDPDQARRFVGPDLGPNCLPRLSADDTGRQRVKHVIYGKNKFLWKEQVSMERTSFYGKLFLPIQINIIARLIIDLSAYHFKY